MAEHFLWLPSLVGVLAVGVGVRTFLNVARSHEAPVAPSNTSPVATPITEAEAWDDVLGRFSTALARQLEAALQPMRATMEQIGPVVEAATRTATASQESADAALAAVETFRALDMELLSLVQERAADREAAAATQQAPETATGQARHVVVQAKGGTGKATDYLRWREDYEYERSPSAPMWFEAAATKLWLPATTQFAWIYNPDFEEFRSRFLLLPVGALVASGRNPDEFGDILDALGAVDPDLRRTWRMYLADLAASRAAVGERRTAATDVPGTLEEGRERSRRE